MVFKKGLKEEIKYFTDLKEAAQAIKTLMDEVENESESAVENIERILHILSSDSPDISGNVKNKLMSPHFDALLKSAKKVEKALGQFDKEAVIGEWLPTESAENVRNVMENHDE